MDRCVETDVAGEFVLGGVSADAAIVASAAGHLLQRVPSTAVANSLSRGTPLVLQLEDAPAGLAGLVLDAKGGPIPGAWVTTRTERGELLAVARSSSDGSFELSLPNGGAELCARAEAYSAACTESVAPGEGYVLTLAPESGIRGRVVSARTGEPLPAAAVSASKINGAPMPPRSVRTERDGTFSLRNLAAGAYSLVATASGHRGEGFATVGVAQDSGPIVIEALPAGALDGHVILDGKPCPSGEVELTGPIRTRSPIGAGGSLFIEGLPRGHYEATATCQRALAKTETLSVSLDVTEHVWELQSDQQAVENDTGERGLDPSADVRGEIHVVVDSSSRTEAPDPHSVFARASNGTWFRALARGGGFVFSGLQPDRYAVWVDDAADRAQDVELRPGSGPLELRLSAPISSLIHGRVVDAEGQAVREAWVTRRATANDLDRGTTVLTDDDGAFAMPATNDVAYTLDVVTPDGEAVAQRARAGDDLVVRVPTYGSVSGNVTTDNGEPVARFTILYGARGGREFREQSGYDGQFSLPWLAPGSYVFSLTSDDGAASTEASVTGGADTPLRVTLNAAESGTDL